MSPRRLFSLLGPLLALAPLAGGCLAGSDGDSAEADITNAPAWHAEADVANAQAYAKVLADFGHAERGSFLSDHPKTHDTKQGADVHIAYAIVRAPSECGAVVVSNGRTESFSHYAELAWDLTRRGYSLYLLDHRGQGHSSRLVDYAAVGDRDYQKGHVDDFHDYVDDLAKFVDTVVVPDRAAHHGKGDLYALGHSMGGAILTMYAEEHPETFAKIALSSPMHQIAASGLEIGAANVGAFFGPTAYALHKGPRDDHEPFANNELTGSQARFEAKKNVWNADPETKVGGPTYGWVARSAHATKILQRDAAKIDAPVLLLEAGADKIVDPRGQHVVCDAVNASHPATPSGPACNLVVLAGAEHESLIESDAIRKRALDEVAHFFASP